MDKNHQDKTEDKQIVTEGKLWLPPSFIKNEVPIANGQELARSGVRKKGRIEWGFAGKEVWDWSLLVSQVLGAIAIPFAILVIGLYFTQQITLQQAQLSERQHQIDLQIANDQQQGVALQTYLDGMSDLLLHDNLRTSKPGSEVRNVARARTLTLLPQLNGARKVVVVRFLYEAGLIQTGKVTIKIDDNRIGEFHSVFDEKTEIVDLSGADLSGVDLRGANLSGADLSGANLRNAKLGSAEPVVYQYRKGGVFDLEGGGSSFLDEVNLLDANLENADLSGSYLRHAHLSRANLSKANLSYVFLSDTDLVDAKLYNANLTNSSLGNAHLNGAFLGEAVLENAYLRGASLRYVGLRDANLTKADLTNVDLTEARDVTNEQLAQASHCGNMTLPDGHKHPQDDCAH